MDIEIKVGSVTRTYTTDEDLNVITDFNKEIQDLVDYVAKCNYCSKKKCNCDNDYDEFKQD